jgi:hypothetical protein
MAIFISVRLSHSANFALADLVISVFELPIQAKRPRPLIVRTPLSLLWVLATQISSDDVVGLRITR